MTKTQFVRDLREKHSVADVFALSHCEEKETRTGKPFLQMTLGDHTGSIVGKHWNVFPGCGEPFYHAEFVLVRGEVVTYNGLEIKLHNPPEVVNTPDDVSLFLPAPPVPLVVLNARFDALTAQLRYPGLVVVVNEVFSRCKPRFIELPAAVRHHHAYRHGLLHHTIEVAEMALAMHDRQPGSSEPFCRDLLLAGALLHDVGKGREFTAPSGVKNVTYSLQGELHGHTVLGVQMVRGLAQKHLSPTLCELLLHLITSHHGKTEWGAPVLPKTREALILHAADYLTTQLFYADMARATHTASGAVGDFAPARLLPAERIFAGDYGFLPPPPAFAPIPFAIQSAVWRMVCPWHKEGGDTGTATAESNFATVRLPLLARVAAGPGLLSEANIEQEIEVMAWAVGVSDQTHYLLRVEGNSMTRVGIGDGDLLVVHPVQTARDGEIIVARLPDGGVTVKQFGFSGGGPVLRALSSEGNYPSPFVPAGTPFVVEGVAVGVLRQHNRPPISLS